VTAALCWLAAAVWLTRGPSGGVWPRRSRSPVAPRLPPSTLRWLAAVAVALTGVVVLGPVRGGLGGVVAAPLVVRLVGVLHARVPTRVPSDAAQRVPLMLDLLAAALRSGQPVVSAVSSVAPLAGADLAAQLHQVAGLLRFGSDPAIAWAALDNPTLAPVVRTAVRSAESGVRLARGFELLAADLRQQAKADAVARANRAGVWAMAPLGMCFLPAFACLGVLPVIVGIAHGVLNVTP
jgi:pilus assembly protein TadC